MIAISPEGTTAEQHRARPAGRGLAWFRLAATLLWLLGVTALAVRTSRPYAARLATILGGDDAALRRIAAAPLAILAAGLLAGLVCALLPARGRLPVFLIITALPPAILLTMSGRLLAVAVVVGLLAPPLWLGRVAIDRLVPEATAHEAWALGCVPGLGGLGLLGVLLGRLGQLGAAAIWPALGLLLVALLGTPRSRRRLAGEARDLARWLARGAPSRQAFIPLGALLGTGWAAFCGALAPETGPDPIRLRLAASALFAQAGRLPLPIPDLPPAMQPGLGEVLYALALTTGPLATAKLLNFAVYLFAGAALWALGRRLGGPAAGQTAALAFATFPITVWLAQTAYSDLLATLFAVGAVLAIVVPERCDWRSGLVAAAGIAGGLSVKASFTLTATGLVAAVLLAAVLRGRSRAVVVAGMAGLVVAALGLGWLASGGTLPAIAAPVATLWQRAIDSMAGFRQFGSGRAADALLRAPLDLTLHSQRYGEYTDGFTGYLLLALMPLVLLMRPRWRPVVAVVGVIIAFLTWFTVVQYVRYALPLLAIGLAAGAAAYAGALDGAGREVPRALGDGLLVALVICGAASALDMRARERADPYLVVLGRQPEAAYLRQRVGAYTALRLLDADPTATRALEAREYAQLYTRVPLTIAAAAAGRQGDEAILQYLDAGGFSHILIDRNLLPDSWDTLGVLSENFLRRNATLVGGDQNAYLYRLVPQTERGRPQAWTSGPELLANGDLEQGGPGGPSAWDQTGTPRYDQSGRESRSGRAAVRVGPGSALKIIVPIRGGTTYLLSHATRSAEGYGAARLQINWIDGAYAFLGTSIEVVPASPASYTPFSMLATAPAGAAMGVVYLEAQQGVIWFDDMSLRAFAGTGGASGPGQQEGGRQPSPEPRGRALLPVDSEPGRWRGTRRTVGSGEEERWRACW